MKYNAIRNVKNIEHNLLFFKKVFNRLLVNVVFTCCRLISLTSFPALCCCAGGLRSAGGAVSLRPVSLTPAFRNNNTTWSGRACAGWGRSVSGSAAFRTFNKKIQEDARAWARELRAAALQRERGERAVRPAEGDLWPRAPTHGGQEEFNPLRTTEEESCDTEY